VQQPADDRADLPFLAEEPPILIDWLPWNHTFGANHNVGIVIYNGGTMYIDEGKPTPQGLATTWQPARDFADRVLQRAGRLEGIAHALEKDEALREKFYSRCACSSMPAPRWRNRCGTSCHRRSHLRRAHRDVLRPGHDRDLAFGLFVADLEVQAGQIGMPTPGMEIKLVPNGDKIEIRYRGPNVTPGYWRAPEQTAEAFDEEGYFRTGDAVRWLDPAHPIAASCSTAAWPRTSSSTPAPGSASARCAR
jgi:feruloyl-CoA synthase